MRNILFLSWELFAEDISVIDGTVDKQDFDQIKYNGMGIIVVDQKIGYIIYSAYVDVYEELGNKR